MGICILHWKSRHCKECSIFIFFNGATIESSITIIVDVSGLLLNIQYNLQVNKAPIGDIFFFHTRTKQILDCSSFINICLLL